eukprot:scaffold7924_cov267-Pinguiococcus_pyrenoidosus.AAC.6
MKKAGEARKFAQASPSLLFATQPRRPTADPNEKVVVVQELEPRAELVGEHLRAYAALLESTASPEELQGGDVDDAEDDEELDEEEVEEYLNKRDVVRRCWPFFCWLPHCTRGTDGASSF